MNVIGPRYIIDKRGSALAAQVAGSEQLSCIWDVCVCVDGMCITRRLICFDFPFSLRFPPAALLRLQPPLLLLLRNPLRLAVALPAVRCN